MPNLIFISRYKRVTLRPLVAQDKEEKHRQQHHKKHHIHYI